MKKFLLFFLIVSFKFLFSAENELKFIENKNQWPKKVLFSAELPTGNLFVENKGLTWQLWSPADIQASHDAMAHGSDTTALSKTDKDKVMHGHVFSVEFIEANFNNFKTYSKQNEYYNYFLGNNPEQWGSGANAFGSIYFKNIYTNIDLKYYSNKGNFKYDFIVKSNAAIDDIKLKYKYVNGLRIENNKLIIETSIGNITENIPVAYQKINGKKIIIQCYYKLNKTNEVSFSVDKNYDPNFDLIIDPAVVVASYSGTQGVSFGLGVTTDASNNMYLSSLTLTKNYPVTTGAVQTSPYGIDCAVSKFNSTGDSKRFSTYIGGNKEEVIIKCVVQKNEIAIFGETTSDTFPIIKNGFQTSHNGGRDYFIIKIDTSGKVNIASTYLGGKKQEGLSTMRLNQLIYWGFFYSYTGDMVMDENNNCYIIGTSFSYNYPTTTGAIKEFTDSTNYGEMVITKINSSLSQLIWSTYFGGRNAADDGTTIKLSSSGFLYCLGTTDSKDCPTTPGVVFPIKSFSQDMILAKLNANNGQLAACSYLAFKSKEYPACLELDQFENVYVVGYTSAPASVTATPGAYNASNGNVLFCKLDKDFTQLIAVAKFGYTTPLNPKIEIDALRVDSCGYVYFGGFAYDGMPTTPDAFKTIGDTTGDMYIGVLNPNFSSLKFGSYFGAPLDYDHDDGGLNYFDKRGYFYHADCVGKNFPTKSNAYSQFNVADSVYGGPVEWVKQSDAFVKIDLQTFVNVTSTLGGEIRSCSPVTATFVASTNLGTVAIIPGDGSPISYTNSLVHSYNNYGTYFAYVIAGTDTTTCNKTDSIKTIIRYGPSPEYVLNDSTPNCKGVGDALNAQNVGADYLWSTGQTSQIISPHQSGKYYVKISNAFCEIIDSSFVYMLDAEYPMILPNIITPENDGVNDFWDFSNHAISFLDFTVFNRWGTPVYRTTDGNSRWGGVNEKGNNLSDGTYFWVINFKSDCKPGLNNKKSGYIQIAR